MRLLSDRSTAFMKHAGIFLGVMLFFVSIVGITRVEIDPNNRVFFGPDNTRYATFSALEERFGSKTVLLFLITSRVPEAAVNWHGAIEWLENQSRAIPNVVSVTSLGSLQRLKAEGNLIVTETYLESGCPDRSSCEIGGLRGAIEPALVGRLISKDYGSLAVIASLSLHNASSRTVEEVAEAADLVKQSFLQSFPQFDLHFTGGVPLMSAFYRAALSDSTSLFPITILLMIAVLWFGLGSIVSSLAIVGMAAVSALVSIGLYSFLGTPLNTATSVAPLVILTVVTVTVLHPFSGIAQSVARNRVLVQEDVERVWRRLALPMILSGLSTAVGFFSIATVSSPPLVHLGVLCGVGTIVGCVLALVFFPLAVQRYPSLFISSKLFGPRSVRAVGSAILGKPHPYKAWFFLLLSGALSLGLLKGSFDEDFIDYFPAESEFGTDTRIIGARLSGLYQLDLVVDSGAPEGVFQDKALSNLRRIKRFLADQSVVISSFSLVDVIDNIDDALDGDGKDSRLDAAQLFFLYELGGGSLGEGWALTDSEHRYMRISVALEPSTMGEIRALTERIEDWAPQASREMKIQVTGEGVPTAYLSKETISEMLSGVGLGLVICALSIGLIFRRVGVAIVMLLCAIVPLASGFGLWALLGGDFGMGVSLVVATTIGLVIDDAIHFCSRFFSEESGVWQSPLARARICIDEVAPAMVLTSGALVIGFSALLLSEFKLNYMFGVCTIFVVIWALIFNLTVTPVLMAWFHRAGKP